MIAPHILGISIALSLIWGVALIDQYMDYRRARDGQRANTLRGLVVRFALWTVCFSYTFRTACVLAGFGEEVPARVVFFALLASCGLGGVFTIVSRRVTP